MMRAHGLRQYRAKLDALRRKSTKQPQPANALPEPMIRLPRRALRGIPDREKLEMQVRQPVDGVPGYSLPIATTLMKRFVLYARASNPSHRREVMSADKTANATRQTILFLC